MRGLWTRGYTQIELDRAQERYGLTFPPDLIELYLDRRLVDGYDWATENQTIRGMLAWPFELLLFDVEHDFWWPDWGEQPPTLGEKTEVLRGVLGAAPKLIPIYSHRFLPETPKGAGNPVFSMHGSDTIYYGADLENYFEREFGTAELGPIFRQVPFWSDLVEQFHEGYAYYVEDGEEEN